MKWISVKDKLPPEGVPVWACKKGGIISMFAIMHDPDGWLWCDVQSYWHNLQSWNCEYDVDDDYSFITHWAHLPERMK